MSNLWTLLHLANKPPAVDTKLDAISYHIYLRRPAERTDNAILWHDYLEIEYLNTARGLYDTASYGLEALPPVGSAVEAKAGAEAGKFVLAFRAMKNALGNSLYAQEDRSAQTFLDAVEAVLDQRVAAESVASASFKGAIGVATKKNAVVENMPASGADSRDAATGDGGQEGAGGNDKGGGKDAKPAGR